MRNRKEKGNIGLKWIKVVYCKSKKLLLLEYIFTERFCLAALKHYLLIFLLDILDILFKYLNIDLFFF